TETSTKERSLAPEASVLSKLHYKPWWTLMQKPPGRRQQESAGAPDGGSIKGERTQRTRSLPREAAPVPRRQRGLPHGRLTPPRTFPTLVEAAWPPISLP